MYRKTITISEFNERMFEIEEMQDQVERYFKGNFFEKLFTYHKANKLHIQAGEMMKDLFSYELIAD